MPIQSRVLVLIAVVFVLAALLWTLGLRPSFAAATKATTTQPSAAQAAKTATKPAAKKTQGKTTATKAAPKKTAPKKAESKKTTAKKTGAKKATVKKVAVKKAAVKKTSAKKTPVSSTAVRKPNAAKPIAAVQVPTAVKTYLVAGVTPIYTARRERVESFRSPTDTLLLVQLDPVRNVVRTLSLPRDTLLGRTGQRINSVLPRFGEAALVRTVQELTGVRVDAYVLVNLRGVRAMTDAAGGVPITVQKAMRYDDFAGKLHIRFAPGRQTLTGQKAEEFLRFRHDPRGDLGRIDRTRQFLGALAYRLLTPSGLRRLPAVSSAVRASARTNLTTKDFQVALAFAARRPKLETHVLPGFLAGPYWRVDTRKAASVLAPFRGSVRASR